MQSSDFLTEMVQRSWICTVFTQFSLCFALYFVLNVCQLQKPSKFDGRTRDLYFISVRGGFRPLDQQILLLKLMEKVAKVYKARFVVNVSELGDDDPLMQNGSRHLPSLRVPWYTTRVSKGQEGGYFLKQIQMPDGKTLDIIGVDTGSLQDLILTGSSSSIGNNQLNWLTETLQATNSNWRIVVGFHPLIVSVENKEQFEAKQIYQPIEDMFMKHGVNAYLCTQGGTNYLPQDSLVYIGNPGSLEKEPFLDYGIGISAIKEEMVNGFLLHRVSSLEIVTYFVTSAAEVVHKSVLQQKGKEFI